MENRYDFNDIARLPAPDDNVAIVTRRMDAGSVVQHEGEEFVLSHTVLEGHRFAIRPIAEGEPLLSWGLPFGYATTSIRPGAYVCNEKMIGSLSLRNLDFELPSRPNFKDQITPYTLDADTFEPGSSLPRYDHDLFFSGYRREGGAGALGRGTTSSSWVPRRGLLALRRRWQIGSRASRQVMKISMALSR